MLTGRLTPKLTGRRLTPNQQPNRKTCPIKENYQEIYSRKGTHKENGPLTRRLTPKIGNQKPNIEISARKETLSEKIALDNKVKVKSCCLVCTYVEWSGGTSPGPWTLA